MDTHKTNLCVHLRKKYFGEDTRPSTGMCMIVFAIPLLIPGIVITTVAFQDETGFSRFSALHVFGMVLLATDLMLLATGIALCIRFKPKVIPVDFSQVISTHKKIRKEVSLDKVTAMEPSEPSRKGTELSAQCYPSIPPVNYFLDDDCNNTKPEHPEQAAPAFSSIYQKAVTEQGYSKTSLEDDSSSSESYDSDDCSSGSYIIPENTLIGRTLPGTGSERDLSKFERSDLNFKTITVTMAQSGMKNCNNFFQSSKEDSVPEIKEKDSNKVCHSIDSTAVLETNNEDRKCEISVHEKDQEIIQVKTSLEVEQDADIHDANCSPTSRKRLLGFSSESVLTSPRTPMDSNTSTVASQILFQQQTLSVEENTADSRTSVFAAATELKEIQDKLQDNVGKKRNPSWCSERNQNSSSTNSPYAVRPTSFPSRDMLTRSSNSSTATKQSPSLKHPLRPQSTEGYISSTTAMETLNVVDV
ncbi:hypothetical protein BsWGS_06657 [Bradybaena similaris]